jgi:2-deoxy-D-gluconate 3-dehydrogenase
LPILDSFRLDGKAALVTGATRGIGAAIAVALAEAGADVVCHGNSRAPDATCAAIRSAGRQAAIAMGDLADPATAERLIEATLARFQRIDILINNAGAIRRAPAADYSVEDWNAVIAIDLTSVFRLAQLAGRPMLAQSSGKIVNIASLLSFQGGITVPAYAAAKGGVAQITKALANEWAGKGVHVNAIAPGYIATDNTQALRDNETRNRQILERIPAGRWGDPADIAGTAVFLCSDASNYIDGHVLAVDGGWLAR